jgi:hypothetical protein
MDSFGDFEEFIISLEHKPSYMDTDICKIRDQESQDLSNAASLCS